MTPFEFSGSVPASKSIYNRALIVKSYFPELKIIGESSCDDVIHMSRAYEQLIAGQPINCGHAGTVLRFFALRASRLPGTHVLTGSERLFSRPQNELSAILSQLGVQSEWKANSVQLISNGWKLIVDGLQIHSQRSSQFASAVILNGWDLKFPLHFNIGRKTVSEGYLKMTLQMMKRLGMRIEENGSEFFIPANQKLKLKEWLVEPDMSSAFALAALAVVSGRAVIQNIPLSSLQPDFAFISILKKMGVNIELKNNTLTVCETLGLQGLQVNLENSPDLFPVLAVLCALAKTPSRITGVGHLQFKESSRLIKSKELIENMGARMEINDSTVEISPVQLRDVNKEWVTFNTDHDHRMAMAAQVARQAGFRIGVDDMKVVSKSYPEFLLLPGVNP